MSVDIFKEQRSAFVKKFNAIPTDSTLELLNIARGEANNFGHNYIGTEHLLLGALQTPQCAVNILGLHPMNVRLSVESIAGRDYPGQAESLELNDRAEFAIELGVSEAIESSDFKLEPDHIVLGIVKEGAGIAMGVLNNMGVSGDFVRRTIIKWRAQSEEERRSELSASNNAFTAIENTRDLLKDPDLSIHHKRAITAVLDQLQKTYKP